MELRSAHREAARIGRPGGRQEARAGPWRRADRAGGRPAGSVDPNETGSGRRWPGAIPGRPERSTNTTRARVGAERTTRRTTGVPARTGAPVTVGASSFGQTGTKGDVSTDPFRAIPCQSHKEDYGTKNVPQGEDRGRCPSVPELWTWPWFTGLSPSWPMPFARAHAGHFAPTVGVDAAPNDCRHRHDPLVPTGRWRRTAVFSAIRRGGWTFGKALPKRRRETRSSTVPVFVSGSCSRWPLNRGRRSSCSSRPRRNWCGVRRRSRSSHARHRRRGFFPRAPAGWASPLSPRSPPREPRPMAPRGPFVGSDAAGHRRLGVRPDDPAHMRSSAAPRPCPGTRIRYHRSGSPEWPSGRV